MSEKIASARMCQATTAKGKPCNGLATHGIEFCHFHDPDMRAKRQRTAEQKKNVAKFATLATKIPLATTSDIVSIISSAITDINSGMLPPSAGAAIASLCKVASGILREKSVSMSAPDEAEAFGAMSDTELKKAIESTMDKLSRINPGIVDD
jgi:hypothetical protein